MTLDLGWFTAGRGPGSRGMFEGVLAAIDGGSLDARIAFVFMHRERGEGEASDGFMDLAAARGIPLESLSSSRFREEHGGDFAAHRAEYDARVLELLRPHAADLCVLAGYLLIMSPALTHAYRFVNLHPALPDGPVGLWGEVIWELIETGARETGATVLLVADELDRGPRMAYARVPIEGQTFDGLRSQAAGRRIEELRAEGEAQPLFAAIREAGLRREPVLLAETLKALASGDVAVRGERVVDASGAPIEPRDLTAEVEAALG